MQPLWLPLTASTTNVRSSLSVFLLYIILYMWNFVTKPILIYLYADVHRNELLQEWQAHQGQVLQVQYSVDETSIFSIGEDRTVSCRAQLYYTNSCIACHTLCVRLTLTHYIVQYVSSPITCSILHSQLHLSIMHCLLLFAVACTSSPVCWVEHSQVR